MMMMKTKRRSFGLIINISSIIGILTSDGEGVGGVVGDVGVVVGGTRWRLTRDGCIAAIQHLHHVDHFGGRVESSHI